MKRLLVSTVAVLALVTACGVAEDTTAATVGGREISVKDVSDLAKSAFISAQAEATGAALVSSESSGVTGATKQRQALTYLVQTAVFEEELEARGESVTSADRESAETQVASYEEGSGKLGAERKVLLAWVASQVAMIRVLDLPEPETPPVPEVDPATVATPEKIAAFYEQYRDQLGQIACIDGFAVATANQAAAQAALDGGATVAQVVADPALEAQAFSQDGAESCLPTGQIAEQLAALATDTPLGQWATATIEQASGPLVVFIRANSRSEATLDNPTVVEVITQALQQQAQQEAQTQQEAATAAQQQTSDATGKAIAEVIAKADVEIDSRYGTFDPSVPDLVKAPATPRASGPPTTTTVPVPSGQ